MRKFWDAMRAPWEWFHLDVERIVEGEDSAAVAVRFNAQGRGSGVIANLQQGHALWLRHERITKLSAHPSFGDALVAASVQD